MFVAFNRHLLSSREYSEAFLDVTDAARPETIGLIAPLMFIDEPFVKSGPPVDGSCRATIRSFSAAKAILLIVKESPVFPPAVREWARRQRGPEEKIRAMMRKWWNENKGFLEEKRYSEVIPGED